MFNDKYALTEAVLSGTKTMTRRVIPQKFFALFGDMQKTTFDDTLVAKDVKGDYIDIRKSKFNPYKKGDVVAVAQPYKVFGWDKNTTASKMIAGVHNKMYVSAELMPNRIQIIDVKVERLQDISLEDCLKEGIIEGLQTGTFKTVYSFQNAPTWYENYKDAFRELMNKVSKKNVWKENPYVFVYKFVLIK